MKIGNGQMAMAAIFAAAVLPAQTPADPRAAMNAALTQQRAAASAIDESLARQRSSIEKQTGQAASNAFFVLPPPASLGATAARSIALAPIVAVGDCDPLPASEVDSLVSDAAKRQDLDEAVLRGVMQQESAFRPCAVSPKGAMGLMQLMPATATESGVSNPFDPAANVEAGAKLLKELLTRYGGNLPLALGAYNAGPSKVDSDGAVPNIPETQEYVKRILSVLSFKP
jgi:soluble lytic murein transglycosylase-like protein